MVYSRVMKGGRRLRLGSSSTSLFGPDALELVAVAFCALTVVALVAGFAVHLFRIAEVTDAISLAAGVEPDLIEYHAVHGRWPVAAASAQGTIIGGLGSGYYARSLQLASNGAITANLNLSRYGESRAKALRRFMDGPDDGVVSFRPAVIGAPGHEFVVFLCGNDLPPSGASVPKARNQTTLGDEDLPPACRGGER